MTTDREYRVQPDYETAQRAGADGTFQIIELMWLSPTDEIDHTHLVDQGTHWSNLKELEDFLSKKTGVNCTVQFD
ncbi:MAG: hypothetical protein AAFQ12_04470 [Pseudomonadota bacterium]